MKTLAKIAIKAAVLPALVTLNLFALALALNALRNR